MSHEKRDISGVLLIFIMMIIGIALTPAVQEQVLFATGVANATWPGNLSGAAAAIYSLIPLFWIILVLGVGMAGIFVWLKQ